MEIWKKMWVGFFSEHIVEAFSDIDFPQSLYVCKQHLEIWAERKECFQ